MNPPSPAEFSVIMQSSTKIVCLELEPYVIASAPPNKPLFCRNIHDFAERYSPSNSIAPPNFKSKRVGC